MVLNRETLWMAPPACRKRDIARIGVSAGALLVALVAHASMFLRLDAERPDDNTAAVRSVEVGLVAAGEASLDAGTENKSQIEETAATPQIARHVTSLPDEDKPSAEVPRVEDAEAIAVAQKVPQPETTQKAEDTPPNETPQAESVTRPTEPTPGAAAASVRLARSGSEKNERTGPSMSVADYGAIFKAQVNKHKTYPPEARARNATGVVVVRFAVRPTGEIAVAEIAGSSANPILDAAAVQAVRSVSLPAPPGGHFSGRIAVEYSIK